LRIFSFGKLRFSGCKFNHFLQQQSFMEQPQQESPFLRLFIAPMTAATTRPVMTMIAIIVEAFIVRPMQLSSQARILPRQWRTGI
jgi:hypothetical protein